MKKLKFTSLTTAALATAALATTNLNNHTVKADSVDNQTVTKGQTPKEVAQTNVDNAKKDVSSAQNSVNQAQNNLNNAQDHATSAESNYSKQSEAVSAAQNDVNAKSTAVKDAQSKADSAASLASEAKDPSKVKAANDAVSAAEKKVETAITDKKTADKKVADKKNEITTKSEAVTKAQKAVDSASAAKSKADKEVTDAESVLKGTGINEAKTALDNATKKLNDDKSALTKAQADQKNQKSDYDKAKFEKDSADNALKDAQSKQKIAQDNLNKITQQLQAAEKARDEALKNKIIIPDVEKYKKAWKDYEENGELTQDDIDYINSVMDVNQYKSSDADKKVAVDAEHMTEDQIKEVSIFAANIINNVRKQLGYEETVGVSENSIKFAKEVANNYHEDAANGTWADKDWHDTAGLDRAMAKFHATGSEEMGPGTLPTTMDELKQVTYDSLNAMIFASEGNGITGKDSEKKYEFDHAGGILGIALKSEVEEFNNEFEFNKAIISEDLTPSANEKYKQKEEEKESYINKVKQKELDDRKFLDKIFITGINEYINKLKSSDKDNKEFEYEIINEQHLYGDNVKLLRELYDIFDKNDNEEIFTQLNDDIDDDYNDEHPTVEAKGFTEYEFNNLDGSKENIKIKDLSSLENLRELLQKDLNELNNEKSSLVNNYLNLASSSSEEVKYYLKWLDEQNSNNSENEEVKDAFGNEVIITGKVSSEKAGVELSAKFNDKEIPIDTVFTSQLLSKKAGKRGVVYAEGLIHILTENGENSEKSIIDNSNSTLSKLRQESNDAQTSLTNINQSVDSAKKKAESINKIISQYDNLSSKISNLKEGIPKEEQAKRDAKTKYDTLTKSHEELTKNLKNAQSQQNETKEILEKAKNAKKNADTALNTAKNELSTLQNKVNEAQRNIDQAKNILKQVQQHVKDLQNADSIKTAAQSKLTAAKTALTNAKSKLKAEQSKLPALEKAKKEADDAVATAQANLDAANTELETTQTKLKDAQDKLEKLNKTTQTLDNVASTNKQKSKTKKSNNHAKSMKISSVTLTHNAFVYDKNGKVVKNKFKIKFIRRGKIIKPLNAKVVTIKGKKYYQVGKNQFIKVANAKIKTHPIKIKAVLKGKKNLKAVDLNGKVNGKTVKAGKKYHFNEKRTINGKTYYKIAWTNNWIAASKLSVRK